MNCTKAIIPVAGYGTRWLPITKAIEKCMLPVGNRPIIDYVVEDCLRAGIREFIFVVGEEFAQLKKFYGHNQLLEEYLEDNGKQRELEEVRHLRTKARFHYVVQDRYQPYGTATPIWLCRHLIKPGEQFMYVFGDNFFFRNDGSSELADFLSFTKGINAKAALAVNEVPWETVSQYGIVVTKQSGDHELYERIIEKPKREDAPSNLNNSTFYILNTDIFPFVEKNQEGVRDSEHYFTDVLNDYTKTGNELAIFRAKGAYLDCGTPAGWLRSNQIVLGQTSDKNNQ